MIRLSFPTKQKFNLTLQCKGQWKLIGYDENLLSISPNKGCGTNIIHFKALKDIDYSRSIILLVDGQQIDIDLNVCMASVFEDRSLLKHYVPNNGVMCINRTGQEKHQLLSILQKYNNEKLHTRKDGNCFYTTDEAGVPVFIAYSPNVKDMIEDAVNYLKCSQKFASCEDKEVIMKTLSDLEKYK